MSKKRVWFYRVIVLSMVMPIFLFVLYALVCKLLSIEPVFDYMGGRLVVAGLFLIPLLGWGIRKDNWRRVWYCNESIKEGIKS